MAAASPNAPSAAVTRGSWLVRAVVGVAVLGMFLLVALIWIGVFGSVRGEELSPDTFKRRTFQYQEIPLAGWRIGSVWHEDVSGPLEKRLQGDPQLLPPSPRDPPRWDATTMVRGAEYFRGDAEILRRYLTAGDENSPYWLEWTEKHKDLARVLWPAVAAAARSGQYTRLPDLFEAAEQLTAQRGGEPTAEKLRRALEAAQGRSS